MESSKQEDSTWVSQNRKYQGVDNKFQPNVIRSVITNKTVRGWIFLTLFAASVPILVYYFVVDRGTYTSNDGHTCLVETTFRIQCGRENVTANECSDIHCCYDTSTLLCYHYLPSKYSFDLIKDNTYATNQAETPFGTPSLKEMYVSVLEKDENKVSIIISPENQEQQQIDTEKNYKVKLVDGKLMVEILRTNDDLLLNTAKGPLIVSENYWEWSIYLTNDTLFGLDGTIINVPVNSTYTKVIYNNEEDHSTLPILWAYYNKNFHGVVIKHQGPLEIKILPSNLVTLKSLAGSSLELELLIGPTPKDVHNQHVQQVVLPPFWALQPNICRRSTNLNLTQLLLNYTVDGLRNNECIHENLVMAIMNDNNRNTETVKQIIKNIKAQGSHFFLSVPPHVLRNFSRLYDRLEELDTIYKYNSSIYEGTYLEQSVVFPDYSHANIASYIQELFSFLGTYMDITDIDGLVLHDNWPANENYTMDNTSFPYLSKELQEAMSYTLPWNSTGGGNSSVHIQHHNAYGTNQLSSIANYLNNSNIQNIFIMSAAKTVDQTQPSIIQNINASWSELRSQVDNLLFKSISGNHLVSSPVCGDTSYFDSSLQEVLCLRWYLVAATMPIFRISSYTPWREYNQLNTIFAQQIATNTLANRKMLMAHYYTILSRNEPVMRPMFYDFYENKTTFTLDQQYMVGDSILVAHPFSSGRTRLNIYLPNRVGIWYELWGGNMYNSTGDEWLNFRIVETDFVAFIAQGHILPLKDENLLDLIIALNCSSTQCEARGTLFETLSYISFVANKTAITISDIPQNECNLTLGIVNLYYYEDTTSFIKNIPKSEDLCTGSEEITVLYEDI